MCDKNNTKKNSKHLFKRKVFNTNHMLFIYIFREFAH